MVIESTTAAPPLPPKPLRCGGPHDDTDAGYQRSALTMAKLVMDCCGVTSASSVLDVGCGAGRLLHGLTLRGGVRRYVGVDVNAAAVDWLNKNVKPIVKDAEFKVSKAANARYNPTGPARCDLVLAETFDCVALFSVFTHMRLADVRMYGRAIRKALAPDGLAIVTAFVECDVPDEEENPAGYLMPWSGPLHGVRFERRAFEAALASSGLAVASFSYRGCGRQSVYVLKKSSRDG